MTELSDNEMQNLSGGNTCGALALAGCYTAWGAAVIGSGGTAAFIASTGAAASSCALAVYSCQ